MKPVTLGVSLTRCQTVLAHLHLDEDVAGEAELLADAGLAARPVLGDRLARDQDLAELVLEAVLLDALLERVAHLLLVARVGVNDVPLLRHGGSRSAQLPSP